MFGKVNIFGVHATLAAWADGDEWLAGVRGYLADNQRLLADMLAESQPEIGCQPP